MREKSSFAKVDVCEISLVAGCDTGTNFSFPRPKVSVHLSPEKQPSMKPCSQRIAVANQGGIRVNSEATVELKLASMTFRHFFLVLEASEAECLLCLDFLEKHKCDPILAEKKLRLNRGSCANLFHRTAPAQSWEYPVMRLFARQTSPILSGHEAIISVENYNDDHIFYTREGIFEPSQSYCAKQNVLAFNTPSKLQEVAILARIINPGEYRTIYKASTPGTLTILEAGTLAQNNLATEQKHKHSGITKYDIKSAFH